MLDMLIGNRDLVEKSLLLVVIGGTLVNGSCAYVTIRRRFKFNPCSVHSEDYRTAAKARIGCLAIKRALRVEIGFFLVQLGRSLHSVYAAKYGYQGDAERFWAAIEREFATLMLVYLSLADILTARRIARLQDRLHPDPPAPGA